MTVSPEAVFCPMETQYPGCRQPLETGNTAGLPPVGIFLALDELLVLFLLLKKNEALLSSKERQLLVKMEKTLYEHLSISEIESHLGGALENP